MWFEGGHIWREIKDYYILYFEFDKSQYSFVH